MSVADWPSFGTSEKHAAAICYRWINAPERTLEFLFVRTNTDRRWIIPKGWIEKGESPSDAAIREAREEAGVEGRITGRLESFHHGPNIISPWLLEVTSMGSEKPAERTSAWFDLRAARKALREGRSRKRAAALISAISEAHRKLSGESEIRDCSNA